MSVGRIFLFSVVFLLLSVGEAIAIPTTSVTIAGSFQDELGCPGDWQPDCVNTHLTYDAIDDVWQDTFTIPAGDWEYKAALNDSWDVNYGANAQQNGPNISLSLASGTDVKFYYDDITHWVTDNINSRIVTAAGSFQNELGCIGDWQPDCLVSWLQDPDGDGLYSFETNHIPVGSYEVKATINESWDENYGTNGAANGPNIIFSIPDSGTVATFIFESETNILTINTTPPSLIPEPTTLALMGLGLAGIGYRRHRSKAAA